MARNQDIMNVLATPEEFATPQQIADARALADNWAPKQEPKIQHWAQGADYVVRALLGNITNQNSYKQIGGANDLLINTLTGKAPTGGGMPSASIGAQPGQTKQAGVAAPGGDQFADFVREREGFNPNAYNDHKQVSIGYGTRAQPGEKSITKEQAEARLQTELSKARSLVQGFGVKLSKSQEDALTDLTYNSGTDWMKSGLGQAVKSGNWQEAANKFKQYVNASGVPQKGLMERRNALANNLLVTDDKNPVQVASADPNFAPANNIGAPPEQVAANAPANTAPIGGPDEQWEGLAGKPMPVSEPVTASPPEASMAAPQQVAQVGQPNTSAPISGLEQKLPPAPPSGLGLTPQQWKAGLVNPELFQSLLQQRAASYAPILNEVEGGTAWVIPATGERGLIPKPKYGKTKVGDIEFDTIARPGDNGQMGAPNVQMPNFGGGNGSGNTGIPPSGGGVPNAAPQSGTQQGMNGGGPVQPNVFTPPSINNIHSVDDMVNYSQQSEAAKGAANASALKGADAITAPVIEATEKGGAAEHTIQTLNAIKELSKSAPAQNIMTGPAAPAWMAINKFYQGITGSPLTTSNETISSAEAFDKINVMLATLATKELTSRPALMEFQKNMEANPGIYMSPQGRDVMIDFLTQASNQNKVLGREATKLLGEGPKGALKWGQIKDKVYAENPIKINIPAQWSSGPKPAGAANTRVRKFNRATGKLE